MCRDIWLVFDVDNIPPSPKSWEHKTVYLPYSILHSTSWDVCFQCSPRPLLLYVVLRHDSALRIETAPNGLDLWPLTLTQHTLQLPRKIYGVLAFSLVAFLSNLAIPWCFAVCQFHQAALQDGTGVQKRTVQKKWSIICSVRKHIFEIWCWC